MKQQEIKNNLIQLESFYDSQNNSNCLNYIESLTQTNNKYNRCIALYIKLKENIQKNYDIIELVAIEIINLKFSGEMMNIYLKHEKLLNNDQNINKIKISN